MPCGPCEILFLADESGDPKNWRQTFSRRRSTLNWLVHSGIPVFGLWKNGDEVETAAGVIAPAEIRQGFLGYLRCCDPVGDLQVGMILANRIAPNTLNSW
jgi:hypothetical protein